MPPDDRPSNRPASPVGLRPQRAGWQAPSVEDMQAMLPAYEVLEVLGRGGMGAVYKARQKSLNRLVAIKILPRGAADDELKFAERFQNEAQMMAAMNHPAIVGVHDFGETADGLLYFVMEFVDGTDVQRMIQASGRLPPEHALAITAHVCDALAYAHKRGVVHRDIKPANILIDHEGHIKVADFGLAKMHDPAQTSGLTHSSVGLGTPDYVAPEVLSHGVAADHRADIYALGVMLYQMLTGEVPRGMFKLPSQKGIGSDPRFDEIICKAMEQDRDERYQSAMDVRRALDEIKTTPLAKEDGTGILPVKSSKSQPSSARRKSLIIGGIVAVLAVAAFLILSDKTKAPSSPTSESFRRAVAAASPERQVALVVAKINEINHTEINFTPTIMDGKVTALLLTKKTATGPAAPDVSPVAALRDLTSLSLMYLNVADISCLRELRLKDLTIHSGTFTDLTVLNRLPLANLCLRAVAISDFSALASNHFTRLDFGDCPRLRDISFIKGMPLTYLRVDKTAVTDLSPIAGLPIEELFVNPETKLDAALLRSLPALKLINDKPVAEFGK